MKRWSVLAVLLLILVGALVLGSRRPTMEYYDKLTCNPEEKCPDGTRKLSASGLCVSGEVETWLEKRVKSMNKEVDDLDCDELNKLYQEYMREQDGNGEEKEEKDSDDKPRCGNDNGEGNDNGNDNGNGNGNGEPKGVEEKTKLSCKCKYGEWDNNWKKKGDKTWN